MKQEKLDWLADNPFYTKRFAFYIGRRCRSSSIQDVAKEHFLDWRTVKTLEMQYMREQIKRAGQLKPKVIGIRDLDPKGPNLSYRCDRSRSAARDLVRG